MKDPKSHAKRELTPERQKILDDAFKQYRKSKKRIDSSILERIKRFVLSNPLVMKALGYQPKKRDVEEYEKIDQNKNREIVARFLEMNPNQKQAVNDISPDKRT